MDVPVIQMHSLRFGPCLMSAQLLGKGALGEAKKGHLPYDRNRAETDSSRKAVLSDFCVDSVSFEPSALSFEPIFPLNL